MSTGFKIITNVYLLQLLLLFARCTAQNDHEERNSYAELVTPQNSSDTSDKWLSYLQMIHNSVMQYQPCTVQNCSCHTPVIAKDLAYWRDKGGITYEEFLKAKDKGVHYQIISGKLYRQAECIFPARCKGVEHFILGLLDVLPDLEFILNVFDNPKVSKYSHPMPVFSFSKTALFADVLYPAWSFWAGGPAVWPIEPTGLGRWDLKRVTVSKNAKEWPWERKENVIFFRGSRTSSERDPLILLSRAKPHLVDAAYTKNQAWRSDADTLGEAPAKEVPLEEHCKYKYLFNFRGVAASFRLKHLFLCHSLVFHAGEEWVEFFYFALKPWIHYIPVSKDLDDLEELLLFVQQNDQVAHEIAERGFQFIWDHLDMDDVSCYWEALLKSYAALLKWKVQHKTAFLHIQH